MNPLYQQQILRGVIQQPQRTPPYGSVPAFNNPILNAANYIFQTLRNPATFAKQQFPDIPDSMMNNPEEILGYLQQTRGIDNNQLQQILGRYPYNGGK